MRGMILAAGEGTRLRPLTYSRPKPLVPILTTPIIFNILEWLRRFGVTEVAVNQWYQATLLEQYLKDGAPFGCAIRHLKETTPLGTAGAVRAMADFLSETGEPIVVIGGDELIDLDLDAMVRFHKDRCAKVTLSLARVDNPSQYGVVIADADGRIRAFVEKPARWSEPTALVNSGVYLLDPDVLTLIPEGQPYDFGSQLFPKMVQGGHRVYGFYWDGFWVDVGHLETYRLANRAALRRQITLFHSPLKVREDGIHIHPTAIVEDGAELIPPSAVGEGAVVEKGTRIGPETVIGDRSVVKSGAQLRGTILWSEVTIEQGTRLVDCIVADRCHVSSDFPVRGALIVPKAR